MALEEYDPSIHGDGYYDTVPRWGPKVPMSHRRIELQGRHVVLLNTGTCFNAKFFFEVNLIVRPEET